MRAIFCFIGNLSAANPGVGISRIATSVVICMAAFENHKPVLLRQWPGIEGSQNLATGIQLRNALITHHVPYVPSTPIITMQMIRIFLVANTRKYCIRMEAFAHRTAAL